jgi:hypothetical protein
MRTIDGMRPICHRLSDLDKFIPELGFVPIEEIRNLDMVHCDYIYKERDDLVRRYGFDYWIDRVPNRIIQKLFTWHFWLFGEEYFEKGLVIDKLKQQ